MVVFTVADPMPPIILILPDVKVSLGFQIKVRGGGEVMEEWYNCLYLLVNSYCDQLV